MDAMMLPTSSSPAGLRAVGSRWAWRALALLLCGLHAYVARHVTCPDGVSYLDIAGACVQGDWAASLNPYWSPLYPWLLAAALAVLRPTAYWEPAVAHGVNFGIFVVALVAFEWLLSELLLACRRDEAQGRALPDWALAGLGYALFLWVSRRLVTVSFVTPDMCVAALAYAAAALLLRLRRLGPSRSRSLALGLVLGLAYLAKTVMFPLGFVFLAVSGFVAGGTRPALRHLAWAGAALLLVAGAFIAPLSASRGYWTFGDSGRLNYAWYVGGVPRPHAPPDLGAAHPPRRLPGTPQAWELAGPAKGTYPLWYDPSYWYEGVRVGATLGQQLRAIGKAAITYYELLAEQLLAFTLLAAVLFLFALAGHEGPWHRRLGMGLRRIVEQRVLLVPTGAALGLYLLVGHVEGRLAGPFLVLAGLAVLAAARSAPGQEAAAARLAGAGLAVLVGLLAINLAFDAGNAAAAVARGETAEAHPDWQAARALGASGLRPGDGVAFVGFTFDACWARLGGYRIVAEVPETQERRFWEASPGEAAAVLAAFRRAGARAVVARHPPGPGWQKVSGTDFTFRLLEAPVELAGAGELAP